MPGAGAVHHIRAIAILEDMKLLGHAGGKEDEANALVFPITRSGRPFNDWALLKVIRRHHAAATVHGFRSAFRDWAAERTNYPSEAAELALAHTVSSKVEQAYRRGDLFERRRRMMRDWAAFCGGIEAAAETKIIGFPQTG